MDIAIIARKEGMIQIKYWKGKGETGHKIKLHEEIVGITIHDYRQQKYDQLICILKSGKVTGLNVNQEIKKTEKNQVADEIKLEQ